MRKRLLLMGMLALGTLVASTGPANAQEVTDRNLYERGQMPPSPDSSAAFGHVNAMMQERFAQAGGPTGRSVTAFAEDIVKTLPLIPGASVITYPHVLPSGNLVAGTGRGIGFASITVHEPVTGTIIWDTPRYLGPLDYATQRTVGPGAYLGGYPGIIAPGQGAMTENYMILDDAHNAWAFDADSGELKWVQSHSDWPAGPQRVREEPLRPNNMDNDTAIGLPTLPAAVRAPSGEPLVGSLFTRGNFVYLDALDGSLAIVQNGDVGNVAVGYSAPILYAIIDLLCFPGGQVSLEFKDFCSAFVYTRYFSVNTVMADPVRNRVTVTYAGDGATFDRFMTWEFITDGGPGQPGTILPDPDFTDGVSPSMQNVWSANFGFNSGSTPTWSDSGAIIYGVDGAGITNAFDADTGEVIVASSGGAAGFSPSTDHNDILVVCSASLGLVKSSPVDGRIIWANKGADFGLRTLPVIPDAPLLASGRPDQECTGFPATHPDRYNAQFALGYPFNLYTALKGAGIPVPSTILTHGTMDFAADANTGETLEAPVRSIYTGSGEASTGLLDSGRALSGRVDAMVSITAGIINLLLPARFDVSPPEGGFVISEPTSFRESIGNQFEGIEAYCSQIKDGLVIPGPLSGTPDDLESIPPVDSAALAEPRDLNRNRQLQIHVNKLGYINSIAKQAIPGRMASAKSRVPSELNTLGEAAVNQLREKIIALTTEARDAMLGEYPAGCAADSLACSWGRSKAPSDADRALTAANMAQVCDLARVGQFLMSLPTIPEPAPEPVIPEGDPHCFVEYDLDATFQIADTTLSAGDATNPGLVGKMIMKYVDDGAGNIQPGRVEMMWVWVYQNFDFVSSPSVYTKVHNFSPSCSGVSQPAWSACSCDAAGLGGVAGTSCPEDPNCIPTECTYVGDLETQAPVAIGELLPDLTAIGWQNCEVDATKYWIGGSAGYTEADAAANSGRGCIALKAGRTGDTGANENVPGSEWHSWGNVFCDGSNALCSAGNLAQNDNIQNFTWPQPLVHGPVGGADTVNMTMVSGDTIAWPGTNPLAVDEEFSIEPGYQSVHIPTSAPSSVWLGATGVRVEGGATTCLPLPAP